jgi:lysophospholipase L1-like esterase
MFKDLVVDNGGTIAPVKPYNRFGLFIGDSITAGINVFGVGSNPTVNCAEKTFPYIACQNLNVACIRVGFGGTVITKGGSGGVPSCINYIDYMMNGVKEKTDIPDFIVINHGTNDAAATQTDFETGYAQVIQRLQRKYPGIVIFVMRPFSGSRAGSIQNIASQYKNVFYVDTTSWAVTFSDGTHPDANGGQVGGTALATAIKKILGSGYFLV